MDLKEVEKGKVWIIHLIDAATTYTATCLIRRRKKELVVSHISDTGCLFWSNFKFHSGYGGEFANDVFHEINKKLGIENCHSVME